MEPAPQPPSTITIAAWRDPILSGRGHHVNSLYVEFFWLPVLGPSATMLLRRCAIFTARRPHGTQLDSGWLSSSLGLGNGDSRNAPLPRAIQRCIRFGAARRVAHDHVAVRSVLAPLTQHHVSRLHPLLQELHANWDCPPPHPGGVGSFESR
jgi:hypothetical protein